jgi:hypothetical protein
MLALLAETPLLSLVGWLFWRLLPCLLLVAAVSSIVRMAALVAAPPAEASLRDGFEQEECLRRRRLGELRARSAQMEDALTDLRAANLTEHQSARAQLAETELAEALGRVRTEMASERGGLLLLDTMRWFSQLDPLLRDLNRLEEHRIRHWLTRLPAIQTQGGRLMSRMDEDQEAVESRSGDAAHRLLAEALTEIDAMRGDLVTARAELLTRGAKRLLSTNGFRPPNVPELHAAVPGAGPQHDHALLLIRTQLQRARAEREVTGWMAENRAETRALPAGDG